MRCPFCGGMADVRANWWEKGRRYLIYVQCQRCNAQTKTFQEHDNPARYDWDTPAVDMATDAWNTRVTT